MNTDPNETMNTVDPRQTISSTDLWLVAYVLSRGPEIVDAIPDRRGELRFVLDDSGGRATSAMRAYLYGSPRVNAHDMKRCVRTVRGVIWDHKVRDQAKEAKQPPQQPATASE
jgi:hypothetical protein